MSDNQETKPNPVPFDFSAYPEDTLFYDRRTGVERREALKAAALANAQTPQALRERRVKKERRKRIDPTTFDKAYTDDEIEFMNAMQSFKVQTGKTFPSHGEVLRVARQLGYRKRLIALVGQEPATEA